jgi:hypothetical protein
MLPSEFIDALNAIQAGLGEVPVPVLAAILLAGPTLMWLGFRYFVVEARKEAAPTDGDIAMYWICERCRSANQVPGMRCYHCGMDQAETTGVPQIVAGDRLIVVDGVPTVRKLAPIDSPLDHPLVAVGPGHDPFAAVPRRRKATAPAQELLVKPATAPVAERSSVSPDVVQPPPAQGPVAKPPRRAVVVGAAKAKATAQRRKRSSVSQSGSSTKGGTTRAEGST